MNFERRAPLQPRLPCHTTIRPDGRSRRQWTEVELAILRVWYRAHSRRGDVNLLGLALLLGTKNPQQIARRARKEGLTTRTRVGNPRGRRDRRKHPGVSASEVLRRRHARRQHPMLGKTHTAEAKQKAGAASKRYWSEITEADLAQRAERMIATKVAKYGHAGPARTATEVYSRAARGRRDDLGGQFFRSRWEANYARYLNWLIAHGQIRSWRYEPKTFVFPVRRGTVTYLPDFEVTERDGAIAFHEVKGWMDAKSQTKLRRMAKYYPEVKVVVIGRREYSALAKWGARLIPGWESR